MTRARTLVPAAAAARFRAGLRPLVRSLHARGIRANDVTAAGAVLSAVGGGLIGAGQPWLAAVALAVGGAADTIDGELARLAGRATAFGGFLDSVLDRLSDASFFVGSAVLAFRLQDAVLLGASLWGLVASFLISYARARAESLSRRGDVGIAPREARAAVLVGGVLLWALLSHPLPLTIAIALTSILATITVAQRIAHVARQD
jgi:CDP-diacylglycerol--glycerol-3-phosphate 3-phosphatidyltransferase